MSAHEVILLYKTHYIIVTVGDPSVPKVQGLRMVQDGHQFLTSFISSNEVYKTQKDKQKARNSLPQEWGRNKTHLAFQQPLCLFSVLDGHAAHYSELLKTCQLLEVLHRWMMYLCVEPVSKTCRKRSLLNSTEKLSLPQDRQMR